MTLAVVILAAGQGTRMNSKTQKILHEVGGKPMVQHVFDAAETIADLPPVVVVGPGEKGVSALFGNRAAYVVQPEQLGTGHATQMARPILNERANQVLVTYGDMPLLRASTMGQLADAQQSSGAAAALPVSYCASDFATSAHASRRVFSKVRISIAAAVFEASRACWAICLQANRNSSKLHVPINSQIISNIL